MTTGPKDPFGLIGQMLDGRFRVQNVVATGGFGTVYSATHALLDSRLALKVLRVPSEVGANDRNLIVEAFRNEARALAHLAHPSIVRALDFGVSQLPTGDCVPWMALEWIEGFTLQADLRARLGSGGRTAPECLHALRAAFDALGYAHKAGLAHRDVKPANLMYDTRAQIVKVLDFGIAKVMSGEEEAGTGHTRTRAQFRAYSPSYAAPEQVVGTRTGPWTDVHAMGLILTEMLTDRPAYRAGSPQLLMAQAVAAIRPTPGVMGFDVGAWEEVIQRALAVAPRDRFADAHEFLAALEATVARASMTTVGPTGDMSAQHTNWMGASAPISDTVVTGDGPSSKPASLAPQNAHREVSAPVASRGADTKSVQRLALIGLVAFGTVTGTWLVFRRPRVQNAMAYAAASIRRDQSPQSNPPVALPISTPAPSTAPAQRPERPVIETPAAVVPIQPTAAPITTPMVATNAASTIAAVTHHSHHASSGSSGRNRPASSLVVPLE